MGALKTAKQYQMNDGSIEIEPFFFASFFSFSFGTYGIFSFYDVTSAVFCKKR